jgi:hypothetical protein
LPEAEAEVMELAEAAVVLVDLELQLVYLLPLEVQ